MNLAIFDKDTMLDLTVNIVPLFIMGFFIVGFLLVNPWSDLDLLTGVVAQLLLIVPFVLLALLTYVAAVKIEGGE